MCVCVRVCVCVCVCMCVCLGVTFHFIMCADQRLLLVSCPDHTPHFATREAGRSGNNRQKACIFLTLGLEFETTNEIIGWLIITGKLLSYAIEPH